MKCNVCRAIFWAAFCTALSGPLSADEGPARRTLELYTDQLVRTEQNSSVELYVQIAETAADGKGARYLSNAEVPAGLAPLAIVRFVAKEGDTRLIERQVDLIHRCCGTRFHAPLAVPDEAADGHVEVELSFAAWPEGLVESCTVSTSLETHEIVRTVMPWDTWRATAREANRPDGGDGDPSGAVRLPVEAALSVAFSQDGRQLAVAARDSITLWDVASGRQLAAVPGRRTATALDYSPAGRRVAIARDRAPVVLYDFDTDSQRATDAKHDDLVAAVRFSPRGEWVVSAGQGYDRGPNEGAYGEVRFWRSEDGAALATLRAHDRMVQAVAVAPDGRTLATGSSDSSVKLWRVGEMPDDGQIEEALAITNLPGDVRAVAFAPTGTVVAAGVDSFVTGSLRLFDATDGKPLATLDGLPAAVHSLAMAELPTQGEGDPRQFVLAAGISDFRLRGFFLILAGRGQMTIEEVAARGAPGLVRIWQLQCAEGKCLLREAATLVCAEPVRDVALAPDGSALAAAAWAPEGMARNSVYLWRTPAVAKAGGE